MANRFYFGRDSGDDGVEGRGGDFVHQPAPVFCDECGEQIEGDVVREIAKAPNGRQYELTFHLGCAALRAESRAA